MRLHLLLLLLHLDKGIPAENFWSLVVYSRMKELQYNEDGSIDLYVGPEAPAGKESNWIRTPLGEGWFPLFRFYGTQQAFFDKTWVIGDLEKL